MRERHFVAVVRARYSVLRTVNSPDSGLQFFSKLRQKCLHSLVHVPLPARSFDPTRVPFSVPKAEKHSFTGRCAPCRRSSGEHSAHHFRRSDRNTFFVTAGRALANVGTMDFSRKAVTETGGAGKSFAAGRKSQRSMNAIKRRYGDILEFKPSRA